MSWGQGATPEKEYGPEQPEEHGAFDLLQLFGLIRNEVLFGKVAGHCGWKREGIAFRAKRNRLTRFLKNAIYISAYLIPILLFTQSEPCLDWAQTII